MTTVAPGTRIGPYDVTSVLGVGGMGVAFRARDAKLQRDVALKFLPEHLANDHERLSRFQREAQVLASLNHPHIAQIYGFEESAGAGCIVMELVEGDALADRIKGGRAIPIDEALEIAEQIADGLEAAHERGIMHRDLKPANIKITSSGHVKVLDFGLAKVFATAEADADPSNSSTLMSGSMPGMILGTASYMSPEQARGKSVDARTDVWAFACVVYEMLTGRKAFEGETPTDSIAKILTGEPDWTALPAATPPSVRLLLNTALNKNPKQRLQHIRDARLLVQASRDEALELVAVAPPIPATPSRTPRWWIAALLALALLGALIPASLYFMRPAENSPITRFLVNAPDGMTFSPLGEAPISPDGRKLAFIAFGSGGSRLWVQALDAATPQPIPGTEQANAPFWSPDSREIAFFAQGKLKKVNLSGGQSEVVCAATSLNPGIWSSNGVILFNSTPGGLYSVSASGGTPTPVTTLDPARKDINHIPFAWLPGGRQFLYTAFSGLPETPPRLIAGSLDSDSSKLISAGANGNSKRSGFVAYVDPGYLLLLRDGALVAQHFDASTLELKGDPSPLVDQASSFSVSANGVLTYMPLIAESKYRVAAVDRSGLKAELKDIEADDYREIELAPNGKFLALEQNSQNIWLHDLVHGVTNKSTFASGSFALRWSADEDFVVFSNSRGILRKPLDGGDAQLLIDQPDGVVSDVSRDGHSILYSRLSKRADLWIASLEGQEWKAKPFVETDGDERNGQFSPNGRSVAYASDESGGRYEIYIRSRVSSSPVSRQMSKNGGVQPRWRRDGLELFFLSLDGKLMTIRFDEETLEWGAPRPLFDTGTAPFGPNGAPVYNYAVTPDGQHFYVKVPMQTATAPNRLHVILNWPALLKEKK
jgi:eukaryotic-like serine/threonine-protein kinase